MNPVVVGNLISFIGSILMVAVGFIRHRKTIITVQCIQFGIMGIANYILGGITGSLSAFASILRNIVCLKWKLTVPLKFFFMLLQIVLSFSLNSKGIIGWLPIIAACIYTWFIDTENDIHLKVVIIAAQTMWLVFDLTIKNYVSFCFDIFTIISTTIGIIRIRRSCSSDASSKIAF